MKNIIIADGQSLYSEGIKSVLKNKTEYNIRTFVSCKDELFHELISNETDILIIDFETIDGFEISDFSNLKVKYPRLIILVVNANKKKDTILKVLKTGITNYIFKDCDLKEFEVAFNATSIKEKYFNKLIIDVLLNKKLVKLEDDNKSNLTNKEIEIIKLIAQGLTTKEIANKNFTSYHTVTTHRKNILNKLGLKNTSELVMYAVNKGIVDVIEYYI